MAQNSSDSKTHILVGVLDTFCFSMFGAWNREEEGESETVGGGLLGSRGKGGVGDAFANCLRLHSGMVRFKVECFGFCFF